MPVAVRQFGDLKASERGGFRHFEKRYLYLRRNDFDVPTLLRHIAGPFVLKLAAVVPFGVLLPRWANRLGSDAVSVQQPCQSGLR